MKFDPWQNVAIVVGACVIIIVVIVCGLTPSAPAPTHFEAAGEMIGYATLDGTDAMCAIAIKTNTKNVIVIVVNKDNPLDRKTSLVLRTVKSVKELRGKDILAFGGVRDGHCIAWGVIER